MKLEIRPAQPEDHDWVVSVADEWWGRPVVAALPRLFLDHFHGTSLVAELDGTAVRFLIGFMSPSQPAAAYIHFVGVDPAWRSLAVGRRLYERFFEMATAADRSQVLATTSPTNEGSIAFHRRLGFDVSEPIEGYHRPGAAHVSFKRQI